MTQQEWIKEILKVNDKNTKISEKQARIVEAAIEIFSEKGYASTSTSEIAKKAGVAEGTIFRHFKTKKDLLLSIVSPTLTKIVTPFLAKEFAKEIFESKYKNYEDFIRVLIRNRYDFTKKNLPILKIFIQEIAFHNEIKEEFKKVLTKHIYSKFEEIVKHFQDKGEIIDIPPSSVIRMTITTLIGFLVTSFLVLPQHDYNDEVEIERTINFIMNGLKRDEF